MTVANYNWTWQEGEDLVMSLIYREGPLGAEVPVDLTGYDVRMDVVSESGQYLYTFNSADILDTDPVTPGDQNPDTVREATLASDGTITIVVPRAPTLPGGSIATIWTGPDPIALRYDIFLRSPENLQKKILRGIITVERSYTKWL